MHLSLITLAALAIAASISITHHYKNPGLNQNPTLSISESIYTQSPEHCILTSCGTTFAVHYITNAPRTAINPNFPCINIQSAGDHNAWIHVVQTSVQDPGLASFVDASPDLFPIYSYDDDNSGFFDAPLWTYHWSPFADSLTWCGHAYAVQVDHQHKALTCLGGIGWGFTISPSRISPIMIKPHALTQDDWNKDLGVLGSALSGYNILTTIVQRLQ